MKKDLLLCLFILSNTTVFAQLTNLDFENWYTDTTGNLKLNNWVHYAGSAEVAQGHLSGTTQDTGPYSGNYALTVSRWNGFVYDHVVQSAALTQRTMGITGYYKYVDAGSLPTTAAGSPYVQDSADVKVAVTRWNATTTSRDTIGVGESHLPERLFYTPFSLNVNYTSTATPDSIFLHISPTIYTTPNYPKCPGGGYCSFLTIDDIAVQPVGIATIFAGVMLTISPNPVTDVLTVIMGNNDPRSVLYITDMAGRTIQKMDLITATTKINISELPCSMYIVTVAGTTGMQHFKIIKQ